MNRWAAVGRHTVQGKFSSSPADFPDASESFIDIVRPPVGEVIALESESLGCPMPPTLDRGGCRVERSRGWVHALNHHDQSNFLAWLRQLLGNFQCKYATKAKAAQEVGPLGLKAPKLLDVVRRDLLQ